MNKKFIIFVCIVVGLASLSGYFYLKYKRVSGELEKVVKDPKQEAVQVLNKVGELMDLPKDEEPTVATVTDKEKLVSQKFFEKAENGDKVIIFVKAQKAILYRPSTNKIIEVARIDSLGQNNIESNSGIATASATPTPTPISMNIYNGTVKVGISADFVEKIKNFREISVSERLNATRRDYKESQVIDLGGKNGALAIKVAEVLGLKSVGNRMPEGEATPSSELVVILGEDFISSN